MARTKQANQKNKLSKDSHRGHREGSIFQRANGSWVGQIQVGFKPDGRRKFISKTSKDKQEVLDWMFENQNNIRKDTFIEPKSITLEQWLWNWLTTYKFKSVSSNTYVRYYSALKKHIIPNITKLKLKDVRTIHIQNIYNKLIESGMSDESLKHIHIIFNQALHCAVVEGLISKNYAEYTERKKVRKKKADNDIKVFTRSEQQDIIDNLPFTPLGVLIRVDIGTGARLGELLGLGWNNVDLEKKVIHIREGLVKITDFSDDGKTILGYHLEIGELKTPSSIRDIPINDATAHILAKYKLSQRAFINNRDIIPDRVFLNEEGNLWDESNCRKSYKRLLKSMEIAYIKPHGMRHTYATRILEANVPPKVAQELLGHSDIGTTMNIYSHVLPNVKREAVEKIKEIV